MNCDCKGSGIALRYPLNASIYASPQIKFSFD